MADNTDIILTEQGLKKLGETLWNLRTVTLDEQGKPIGQQQVAEAMKIDQPYISKLENSTDLKPYLLTIIRYLNAIGHELVIRKKLPKVPKKKK